MIRDLHKKSGIVLPIHFRKLSDEDNNLTITAEDNSDNNIKYKLYFELVYGYRNFDESDMYKYIKRNKLPFSGIYELEASELLDWAARENIFEELPTGLKHYLIAFENDIIEVLAFDPPVISRIIKEN